MIARKALAFLVPVALGALVASQWDDISRYMKIKQMSYGDGHPENVPAAGRASYPHPGEQADDPKGPIDESSPDL